MEVWIAEPYRQDRQWLSSYLPLDTRLAPQRESPVYRQPVMSPSTEGDVFIDEPWLLLRWDREHRCVFAEWKAFASSKEFQGALTKALEVGRERQPFSFVNDTRGLELISDEDQRWIRYTWAPLAIRAGVRRLAVVIAPHGLSKLAIQEMFRGRRDTGEQLQSRTFDSLAEALSWVEEA